MTAGPAVLWFRRDLRLSDNPALLAAAAAGPILPVFVLDPVLLGPAGDPRLAFLHRTLAVLDAQLRERGTRLLLRTGPPSEEIPRLAAETGADSVHIAADFGPYGTERDRRVADNLAMAGVPLVPTGSPYAVAPGRVRTEAGDPYRVFTPFYRAWRRHGWPRPVPPPGRDVTWYRHDGPAALESLDRRTVETSAATPPAGEPAAQEAWHRFRRDRLPDYAQRRNHPADRGTSGLSVHLKFGTLHPRTLLAGLEPGDDGFARQLAWRDFYAAVLHFWPASAHQNFQPAMDGLPWATGHHAERRFAAWSAGRTGYPLVDAGMRQLVATGWMHNRVRMVTASFLVKDLHIHWSRGARFFMRHLVDGDLASNQHGWQWTAGTGTDAAPYFRVLNPVTQSRRFDPGGDYIRRWVPELTGCDSDEIHTPWQCPGGPPDGYPTPIVDHAVERRHALADYQVLRASQRQ